MGKDELLDALKGELERLKRGQNANQAANRALNALEDKINNLEGSKGTLDEVANSS